MVPTGTARWRTFAPSTRAWLDAQLTRSIISLLDRRLVTLHVVAQDGLCVRAQMPAAMHDAWQPGAVRL